MKKIIFLLLSWSALISAQQSFNMTLLSNLNIPNLPSRYGAEYSDCWGFHHANGTEIAIIAGTEDIFFVDVTAPANPVILYTHHVLNVSGNTNQSLWRDFKTYQNYIYACADEGTSGLLIFDMSQLPASITLVTQTNSFWNRTHTIFIDEENAKLYAAGSNTVNNGLVILNLNNPIAPTLAANVPLNNVGGGYVHAVYVRDNVAYCSHGSLSKIQIYDFGNLPTFTVIGSIENYPEPGYNHSSWLNNEGNMLVMCDETHGSDVKIVDVSDPTNISSDDFHTFHSELLGPDAPGSSIAHNPYILGDFAYISYYHDGVQVFDISNPNNIEQVAYYDTYPDNTDYNDYFGCWGVYPFLPSGLIIASDMTYGLFVMQITTQPLDIQFTSFQAYRKKHAVRLDWSIADASSGNLFEIMQSANAGITFQSVGKVDLQEGKSTYTYSDYSAVDDLRYVYRIDFVQSNGSKVASPFRYVRAESQESTLQILNPIGSDLVIDVVTPVGSLDMKLFNMEGQPVWADTASGSKARLKYKVDGLPAGQYILTAHWPEGSQNVIIEKIN
jgi:choice-of-anchor B domain-containing protein